MVRKILGRDEAGLVVDIEVIGEAPIITGSNGSHPDLATHTGLGLASAHAHPFAADDHTHAGGSHPDLATHDGLGLATDAELTTHAATAHGTQAHAIGGASHTGALDHSALGAVTANQHHNQSHAIGGADHTGSLTAGDVGAATSGHDHDADYADIAHTHPGGSEAFPVGSIFLSVVSTNPATLLGYGTWSAFGAGRMLLGFTAGDTDEATGGAATHTHAGHTDHAALTHAGATVGNHNVTQPGAHADHTLSGAIATEAAHTHTYTQTVNHLHPLATGTGTTGNFAQVVGTVDTSSGGTGGTPTQTALGTLSGNPSGGVASGTSAAGSAHGHANGTLAVSAHGAHSGTAVDAHTVGQASQHAAQSHSAHDSPSSVPPYVIVRMWKRTA